MQSILRQPVFSKISVKNQTVIPIEVCERLKLRPGDILRYRATADGVLLDKATGAAEPFATFSEWTSDADEKAYGGLLRLPRKRNLQTGPRKTTRRANHPKVCKARLENIF
jgi:antitoxin PrlF